MTINVYENNEMSELILSSLKEKVIDIKNVVDIKAYFDAVIRVINYTAIGNNKTVKGSIYF